MEKTFLRLTNKQIFLLLLLLSGKLVTGWNLDRAGGLTRCRATSEAMVRATGRARGQQGGGCGRPSRASSSGGRDGAGRGGGLGGRNGGEGSPGLSDVGG